MQVIDTTKLLQFSRNAQPYIDGLNDGAAKFGITTPARIAAFLAQVAEESDAFRCIRESFNYSVDALLLEFAAHLTVDQAKALGRQEGETCVPPARQAEIANLVYANRMGNGAPESGDGANYRGRGLIQITGRDEYALCGAALELDLVGCPQLLEEPEHAAASAAWYFGSHGCNNLADAGDFEGITRAINGGLNGESAREWWWTQAKALWPEVTA